MWQSVEAVKELFAYAKPSASHVSAQARRSIDKMCEVCKMVMQLRVRELLRRHCNDYPLVRMYTSDGTPLLVNKSWRRVLGSSTIRRHGRAASEYLVERTFFKGRDAEGHVLTAVSFRDPLPLSSKAAWGLFSCMQASSPTLRSMGCRGPVLEHYVWDRGYFSALDRLVRKAHLYESNQLGGGEETVQGLTTFVLTRPDILHDCSTSFSWGMKPLCTGDLMKDAFVTIASIRNAYSILMSSLPLWLPGVIHFVPAQQLESEANLLLLWQALGIEDEVLQVLVSYRLLFLHGRFVVAAEVRDQPDFLDTLMASVMGVWRFVTFSESRWLTLGRGARSLIASHLTGLFSLLDFCRQRGCSEFHIHGVDRCTGPVRTMFAVAAMASSVPESVLAEVLEDDRVMMNIERLEGVLADEVSYLQELPERAWQILATTTPEATAWELRSMVLRCACVVVGHLTEKVFGDTQKLPWRLCRGDKAQNLVDLAQGEKPSEPTSGQLWELMHRGWGVGRLVEVLEEVEGLSWSSIGAEQAHAGAAQVMRHHPDFHEGSMTARAFLYIARSLFSPEEEDNVVEKLEGRIASLRRSQVGHISARHVFLADCMGIAKVCKRGATLSTEDRKELMRQHGVAFANLPEEQRLLYSHEAAAREAARRSDMMDECNSLQDRVDLLRLRQRSSCAGRSPWTLAACKMADEDIAAFVRLLRDSAFSRRQVEDLREHARQAPPLPDWRQRMAISRQVIPTSPSLPKPAWIGQVCAQRAHFYGHGLMVQCDLEGIGTVAFFEVLYAYQNPIVLCLARLQRQTPADILPGTRLAQAMLDFWEYEFEVVGFEYSFGDLMRSWREEHISVLPGLVHTGGWRVKSHADPLSLSAFFESLPAVPAKQNTDDDATRKAPNSAEAMAAKLSEHPWAMEYLDAGRDVLRRSGAKLGAAAARDEESYEFEQEEEAIELSEEAIAEVDAILSSARAAAASDHLGTFRVLPLGGAWTARHSGIAIDAWQGRAVGAGVNDWCRRFHLQTSQRFDIQLYGQEGAQVCARYWAQKLFHFHDVWRAAGAPRMYTFSDEDLDGFAEPAAFTALVEQCRAPKAQRRFASLRMLRPIGSGV